jgi:FAD/FMN-containing dehydrogenase
MNRSTTCICEPFCIIQPRAAEHVSDAIQIFRAYNVEFAVRSGGHSVTPGASSIGPEGILLDMSMLSKLNLSEDGSFVSVGPG